MKTPFPGMNPYLEDPAFWPDFHRQLVASLFRALSSHLGDRYEALVGQRRYSIDGKPYQEDFLEIHQRSDGKLLTLLDVVSPANKTTDSGRNAYLDQRRQAESRGQPCGY